MLILDIKKQLAQIVKRKKKQKAPDVEHGADEKRNHHKQIHGPYRLMRLLASCQTSFYQDFIRLIQRKECYGRILEDE